MPKDTDKRRILREVAEWDKKNKGVLQIISFNVTNRLPGPIQYGVTAKGACDELLKVHTPNDKQRKYSLIKCLYHLNILVGSFLVNHELTFNNLVQNLTAIGKSIEPEELIILYANSLLVVSI